MKPAMKQDHRQPRHAPSPEEAGRAADLDLWLRRVLTERLAPLTQGPLPPAIAGLAAELEMKLRRVRRQ